METFKFLPSPKACGLAALSCKHLLQSSRGYWLDKAKEVDGKDLTHLLGTILKTKAEDCTTSQLMGLIVKNFQSCGGCKQVVLVSKLDTSGLCSDCHEPSEESSEDDEDDEDDGYGYGYRYGYRSAYCVECGDECDEPCHRYCSDCWANRHYHRF